MMRLYAIARNAFIETIRQPIFLIMILASLVMLLLSLFLSGWTMGSGSADYRETDQMLLVNMGLTTLLSVSLFMAAFSATSVLSREIEDRTVLTVVSKPVPRLMIVLGKYLGVTAALLVGFYINSLCMLLVVRNGVTVSVSDLSDAPVLAFGGGALVLSLLAALFCNYVFNWNFTSAMVGFLLGLLTLAAGIVMFVGKGFVGVPFGMDLNYMGQQFVAVGPDLLLGLVMLALAVLVISAVAVTASTRLGQLMTLLVCLGFAFGASIVHSSLKAARPGVLNDLMYKLAPNLTFLYPMDALMNNHGIPASYVGLSALYALCIVVAVLALGVILFQHRELEPAGQASAAPGLVSMLAWVGRLKAVAIVIAGLIFVTDMRSTPLAVLTAVGCLAGAGLTWAFWGWFGRGIRWTYFVVLGLTVVNVALAALTLMGVNLLRGEQMPLKVAHLALSAVVLAILIVPSTRHHFVPVKTTSGRLTTV